MKKYFLLLAFLFAGNLVAQNSNYCFIFNSPAAVFYGIDFSMVKFRNDGATGFNDLVKIRDSYFFTLNTYFTPGVDKFDLNNYFKKEVSLSLETANSRNQKVDINTLMVDNTVSLTPESINSLLSFYPTENTKSDLGIVLIAEQFNKVKSGGDESFGSYNLVFFKNSDHTILLSLYLSGMAGGMGWANFWWKSIENALDEVKMNKLKKQYCPDTK
jgi:hypothetical protein